MAKNKDKPVLAVFVVKIKRGSKTYTGYLIGEYLNNDGDVGFHLAEGEKVIAMTNIQDLFSGHSISVKKIEYRPLTSDNIPM